MATKADTAHTLVALESFIGHDGNEERAFRQGDLIRSTDAAAKKWPEKFEPVRYASDPVHIESATAGPGEVRA